MNNPKVITTFIIISILISSFSGFTFLKSINTGETWKITASGLGFLIFAAFTFLLIKESKTRKQ